MAAVLAASARAARRTEVAGLKAGLVVGTQGVRRGSAVGSQQQGLLQRLPLEVQEAVAAVARTF
jgi:hypothetical protein